MRTMACVFLACVAMACGGSGASVRDGGSSGSDWKDTGTSADDFIQSTIKVEQDFVAIQRTYREAFLYISMLITHTRDAVGKDRASAQVYAESIGSQFQTPDQLSANFLAQQNEIKTLVNSDGDVVRVLRDFSLDVPPLKAALNQLNETSRHLMDKGPSVREAVAKETTDNTSLTLIQTKVGQKTDSMKSIHGKIPALLRHVEQLVDTINQVTSSIQ